MSEALRLTSFAQGIRLGRFTPQAESNGGEGRIRTSEAAGATDLQSAAFDRFATSPIRMPPVVRSKRANVGEAS